MRYIHINNPGHLSQLDTREGEIPPYTPTQILIKVKATAINRADIMQRNDKYPPPAGESDIPGLEVSGDVVAVGSEVSQFEIGDAVYGLVGSGAYAEFCAIECSLARVIPKGWNYTLAAALPEALTTVYATLFDIGDLKKGQTLLIHGAGSGIASLAIQMAAHIKAKTITTVGNANKIKKAKDLGADQIIEYKKNNFEDLIEDQSVDLIIDFIGGNYFNKHLLLLKPQGKLIQIACLQGAAAECNLTLIMRKRLHIIGFVLRAQSLSEKSRLWKLAHQYWADILSKKDITPVIDKEYSFDQLEQAHQYMQSGDLFGKIVINMN